jgi:hypothetical protein
MTLSHYTRQLVPEGARDCHVHIAGHRNSFPQASNRTYIASPAAAVFSL